MLDGLIQRLTSKPEVLHEYAALRSGLNLGSGAAGCMSGSQRCETLRDPPLWYALGELPRASVVVLVDSPPVLAADDALLLAPLVDGVIVVVHTGIVTERDLKLTKARLEGVGGRVLGV